MKATQAQTMDSVALTMDSVAYLEKVAHNKYSPCALSHSKFSEILPPRVGSEHSSTYTETTGSRHCPERVEETRQTPWFVRA